VIRFRCECGRELQADTGSVGLLARCPLCERTTTVPAVDEPVDSAPAADERRATITRLDRKTDPPARSLPEEPDEDAPARWSAGKPFARLTSRASSPDADAAFTLGMVGGPLLAPLAMWFGIRALLQIKATGGDFSGTVEAITGIAFASGWLLAAGLTALWFAKVI